METKENDFERSVGPFALLLPSHEFEMNLPPAAPHLPDSVPTLKSRRARAALINVFFFRDSSFS